MGQVYMHDEQGNLLWSGCNVLTQEFQLRLLQGITGESVPPSYCAVGAGYAAQSDTPWNATMLEKEMGRYPIDGAYIDPITAKAVIVTSVRAPNINTVWKEVGLFDAIENSSYGQGPALLGIERSPAALCDSINPISTIGSYTWTTGTGNVLSTDNDAVEGRACLRCVGDTALIYKNLGLRLFDPRPGGEYPGEEPVSDWSNTYFQFHLSVNNPTLLHSTNGVTVNLHPTVGASVYWSWTIPRSTLSVGWNFISLRYSDATTTGSFPDQDTSATRIDISATGRSAGMIFKLDSIRLFQTAGALLARSEITPQLVKAVNTTVVISWVIDPFPEV